MWTFRHKLGGLVSWLAPSADHSGAEEGVSALAARGPAPVDGESHNELLPEDRGEAPAADADADSASNGSDDESGAGETPQSDSAGGPDASDPTYLSSGSSRRPADDPDDEPAAVTPSEPATFSGPAARGQNPRDGVPSEESAPENAPAEAAVAAAPAPVPPAPVPPVVVNTAPTDIVVTGGSVDENSPAGTVVATLDAVDSDAGESFTYELTGGDTDKFEIQGNQIVVRAGADLDFETDTDHSVDVRVTDSAGNEYAETVDIAVQDVADVTIQGTNAADALFGGGGAENIQGLGGADKLIGGAGDDNIDGGSGNDRLQGGDGDDVMYGGNSSVNGKNVEAGGDDTLFGQAGDDQLDGGDGDDMLSGGTGDDVLIGGIGADDLQGDEGNDNIDGGSGNDQLQGGDGNDVMYGGDASGNGKNVEAGGNDTLFGQAGDDQLDGGDGDDTLSGGTGDDILIGGVGADDLEGGDGTDTASYEGSSAAVTVDLTTGTGTGGDAQGDTLANIENLTGSDHDDTLTGDAGANVLTGGAGNDSLSGGEGADTLVGGAGNDTMLGGGGNDVFAGVEGNDTMFGEAGDDLFVLDGNAPSSNSWLDGGAGNDTVDLSSATEGWTVVLDNGATISDTDAFDANALSDDAGVVTFEDGAEVAFQNIENLIW